MNVEAEIRDLKRRVGELEGSFAFLTRQVKDVHTDLLAFQDKTEQDLSDIRGEMKEFRREVTGRFGRVEDRVGGVQYEIKSLRDDLPGIVADAVRPLLSGTGKSRQKSG